MLEIQSERTSLLSESLSKNTPLLWILAFQMGLCIGLGILIFGPSTGWIGDPFYEHIFRAILGSQIWLDVKILLVVGAAWISY